MNIRQEIFVTSRYFRARHKNAFIVIVSRLSMIGIALGVATLIVVMAVMNGFEKELRRGILSFSSHIVLLPGLSYADDWQQTQRELLAHPEVRASTVFTRKEVVLTTRRELKGAVLYGIIPQSEDRARNFSQKIEQGELWAMQPGSYGLIIGKTMAEDLLLNVGDRVMVMSPTMNRTAFGVTPRSRRFVVQGIFSSGMSVFDQSFVYAHQTDVNTLLGRPHAISGLRLYLDNPEFAPRVAHEIKQQIGSSYLVRNWTEENQAFFQAIAIEKRVMAVILTLIIAVAVFNVLSSLVMLVSEKRADIAILRAMGVSDFAIMRIFLFLSSLIGVIGTAIGVVLGLILAFNIEQLVSWLETMLGARLLSPDVYIVDRIPSDPQMVQVLLIAGLSLTLGLLASIYPAQSASRTPPAELLRHD